VLKRYCACRVFSTNVSQTAIRAVYPYAHTTRVKLADSPLSGQFKKSPKEQKLAKQELDKITSRRQNRLQNNVYKVIMMNLTTFQGEQLWKTIWKTLKTFVISPTKIILPGVTGYIFQHTLIYFIHSNAMNPFPMLTNGEKAMKYRYKLFIDFSKNCASPCHIFSVIFIPSGSELEDFSTQTDWFYS